MSFQNLIYKVENNLATITVNRPDKLNALNALTVQEISAAVKQAISENDVRIIVITGAGEKSFVAGADISEFEGLNEEQSRACLRG